MLFRSFLSLFSVTLAWSANTSNPEVSFKSPKEGATVTSDVKVVMDIKGLKLRPAGEDANDKNSGHHHLLIDAPALEKGAVVPTDEKHLHFGKAQTETQLKLTPG